MERYLVNPEVLHMFSTFKQLYGVNNVHPFIDRSTSAVRCLKCFSAIIVLPEDKKAFTALLDNIESVDVPTLASSVRTGIPTGALTGWPTGWPTGPLLPYGTCKCNNVSCMLDEQSTLRVYVDDIRTVHIGYAVLGSNNEILHTSFLDYSETFVYTDYHWVSTTPTTLTTKGELTKKLAKKPKVMDLTEALDLSAKAQGRIFFYDTKD